MLLSQIKALCKIKGIKSLGALERLSGLKPRTIYHWGRSSPSVDKISAVAKVLGVTVDELLKDETDQTT